MISFVYTIAGLLALNFTLFSLMWVIYKLTQKASWVDSAWALSVPLSILVITAHSPQAGFGKLVLTAGFFFWGIRLSYFLFKRTLSHPEDRRYASLIVEWGALASAKMYRFFLLQGLFTMFLTLPFIFFLRSANYHPVLFFSGILLFLLALWGESLADAQMGRYKSTPKSKRPVVMDQGLWAYSRHPNYFFEWLCWSGLALAATSAPWGWVSWISVFIIYHILVKVTGIPESERLMAKSKGKPYTDYQKRVPAFFPWFSKGRERSHT